MNSSLANLDAVVARAKRAGLKPPPKLTLSEWAEEYFYLSAESSAEPGRWKALPYQVEIMNALTDPAVEKVSVMKSARVGYTKIINAFVGYSIHQDPCPVLVVQPKIEDAKGYSKEEIAPMLRDCPALAKITFEDAEEVGPKDSGNTILHKRFPGGVLQIVGANSGTGFRRVSRKRVLFDEVDGYPASAGSEGDPVKLGTRRSEYYWDRKIIHGSTPLLAGTSRIEELFNEGDQRRFYVPCPHCSHFDYLVFSEAASGGHFMQWPPGKPEQAYFVCSKNGCVIDHHEKRAMVAAGEWRAAKPTSGDRQHVSFHIWAGYSYSPNASWGQLAAEFLEAKDHPEKLKTFINTVLGETWRERGDAPDWERLYSRRERYQIATVPEGVRFLTAGVDVQKDRWVYEVVGWSENKESWSIDSGVIPGDTSNETDWLRLDELLNRTYVSPTGAVLSVLVLAVDSGAFTQMVYGWARRHPMSRVLATKGMSTARTIIGAPTPVDVTIGGKRIARGCKVWPVGVDVAKAELYGWLRLPSPPEGQPYPNGFCHFPEYGEDYFKQLTAEHLVTDTNRRGFTTHEWQMIPGRENHYLDCRVYARAAASQAGLDRMRPSGRPSIAAAPAAVVIASTSSTAAPAKQTQTKSRVSNWLKTDSDRFPTAERRGKGWLK